MKKIALLLIATLLLSGTALAEKKHYINGIDANYPPFAQVELDGSISGFDVESMNWIADKMGFTVEHQPISWDGIIPSLLNKRIDMVCSGMSISPERKEKVTFSTAYWVVRKLYVVKEGSTITVENILNGGSKLGTQRGTNEAKWLEENAKANGWNFDLRLYDSPPMAIEDVLNGRIDAAALDSAPVEHAMRVGGKKVISIGEFTDPDEFGVATRNEDVALREMINKGYELLMADPHWQELQDKYFK